MRYPTQLPTPVDPLKEDKEEILKILDLIQHTHNLSERDLGLSPSREKIPQKTVLATVMRNYNLSRLKQNSDQGD